MCLTFEQNNWPEPSPRKAGGQAERSETILSTRTEKQTMTRSAMNGSWLLKIKNPEAIERHKKAPPAVKTASSYSCPK